MPIKGSLREASLPDVLQLLALGQKTGRLSVADRSSLGQVYFDRGSICHASIVNRRDRLGDLLVKNGLVDPAVLAEAVEAQDPRNGQRLGEILVARGAISREQLERYLRLQIEEAVYYLFTWTQGSFSFEAGQRPEEGDLLVSINPESLLLEGARRVDEWAVIEKKIPSLQLVFAPDPAASPAAEGLTEEQRRVLPLIDGKRTVQEVIDDSGLVEFDAGKALFGLIEAGYVRAMGRKIAPPPQAASAARLQEHRNLGVAFYRSSLLEEAAREFDRLLELEPGNLDARFHLALIALRRRQDRVAVRHLKQVIEDGGRWASAFHNLALALEGLGRLEDALLAAEEADRLRPDHPRTLLSLAILLLKNGRAFDAAGTFGRYRSSLGDGARPASAYYAFAVLAEAACGRPEGALQLGQEGMSLYPQAAHLALHLAAVQERTGSAEAAELLYRRALEHGPGLAHAHKALGDLLYRRGNYPDAAPALRRAVELNPALGDDVYLKLGNISYKDGAREEALGYWREALRLNPDNGIARTNLELVESATARP